jgi:hypothetical protein
MTKDFVRSVEAPDPHAAIEAVKALAKAEGYRVRTVKSAGYVRAGDMPMRFPTYQVVLAVTEVAA